MHCHARNERAHGPFLIEYRQRAIDRCDKLLDGLTEVAFEFYAPLISGDPHDFGDFGSMQAVKSCFDEAVSSPYRSLKLSHTLASCLDAEVILPEGNGSAA